MTPRALLRSLFDAAVEAAIPKKEWFAGLEPPKGRTVVVGAGKAAASMARAFEQSWSGPLEGVVVTNHGNVVPTARVEVIEASHPVPDTSSVKAARRVLGAVQGLTEDDLVVALISGGGSSLLTLPVEGIRLEEKQAISRELLRCGASISEINTVRKRLSAIKGGRLLDACYPARVVTYVLSDVPGDDPSVVASGPTVPVTGTPEDALAVIDRYQLPVSSSIREIVRSSDIPRKSVESEIYVVASSQKSLEAAAARANELGIVAHILSDRIEGESRDVAHMQAAFAVQVAEKSQPFEPPCVLLSGGETTVTVRGKGRGGRNVEFLAALALALGGHPQIYALAADTDGVDGVVETAGALIDPTTFYRADGRLDEALANNDAHTLFEDLGDSLVTGPTHTNVNDFRAIFVNQQ
jgi:hydroxypyruvate reductase